MTADWMICPGCRAVLYSRRLERNLWVCPECGWHYRISAQLRMAQLFDCGSVEPLGSPVCSSDPLAFVDVRPYPSRLCQARADTGLEEAVVCVRAEVEGHRLIAAVMDFRFLGGSLGAAVGEAVTRAAETALTERRPLLVVTASGGARMQEGVISLMQMAKTSQAMGQLDEAGLLTISLVTDPTFGGVAASYASLSDVIISEPGARFGFAGPRVIQQTIRQKLPEDFQTAESLLKNGFIDVIRSRAALRPTLALSLSTAARRVTPALPRSNHSTDWVIRDPDLLPERPAWEVVQRARNLDRPTLLDYVDLLIDNFEEFHGDRVSGDCPAIVGGVGRLSGQMVIIIGTQKGHSGAEVAVRRYGMPSPEGYRKAARLMRLAAKLQLPLVTLIDTAGAYPGVEAELRGQAMTIAENLRSMSSLPIPIVAVIIGEGSSGGALALAVADTVFMFENAVYSVISPEGCAAILWKDVAAAPAAAEALRLQPRELLRLGVVDGVIREPPGGAESDYEGAAARLRAVITRALDELGEYLPHRLVARRRARYRCFGRNGQNDAVLTPVMATPSADGDGQR